MTRLQYLGLALVILVVIATEFIFIFSGDDWPIVFCPDPLSGKNEIVLDLKRVINWPIGFPLAILLVTGFFLLRLGRPVNPNK
jgi:hypothetical protein